jgi:ubiquinone/menaquinone biosynthesis C-methylase UbiE
MSDTVFTGEIPEYYERDLVPFLFAPWAKELAERIAERSPASVLETAAGTGAVTREIAARCPGARIVATDLNREMLDVARPRLPDNVELMVADACDLPFPDASFDALASQFGIMFYPDRAQGYREALRVLRPGGTMVAAVWGALDANPVSKAVAEAVAATFPGDPPAFLERTPFHYADVSAIVDEVEAAGFDMVSIEELTLPHPPVEPKVAAEGICLGTPLRAEIEERGPRAIERALEAATAAMAPFTGADGKIDARMTALVITATR